jgi:putative DNA primase/helicase
MEELKHQILNLREYYNKKAEEWLVTDTRLAKSGLGFTDFLDMLKNPKKYLTKLPKNEWFNTYYTVAQGLGKREFVKQEVMVFDIDKITLDIPQKYAAQVKSVIGSGFAVIDSGNGLHFIVAMKTPITEAVYFDKNRRHYNALCDKINAALARANLPGVTDPAVFDPRRIMRYPETENRKKDKETKYCKVLSTKGFAPREFDITKLSGLPEVSAEDQINSRVATKIPNDTNAVLEGCRFLQWTKEKPNEISEAQWYGALSITGRLDRKIAHDYSSGHKTYSHAETETKIDQALEASGPRTCKGIQKLGFDCQKCPHFEKVESPIMIRGAEFIKTEHTGFHNMIPVQNAPPKPGKPNYDDLRKFFERKQPYIILGNSKACLIWTGTHWQGMEDIYLENFAQQHFNPPATNIMRAEFRGIVQCTNIKEPTWFTDTTKKKMNFKNGVLDLDTLELSPHSPSYGFRYVLDYDYDGKAKAPEWEKFLKFVTQDRQDLEDVLMEFMGYSFSGDTCWAQRALILSGDGANGKSTFIETLQALAGKGTYTSIPIEELKKQENRFRIDGSLFNVGEETPNNALIESGFFKALIGGGATTGRQLYKQGYEFVNICKLILLCNKLPVTWDVSHGYFRRLLVVPFDRVITLAEKDPFIKDKLLKELPGIFNLVIEGYRRLCKQKKFSESTAVDDAITNYMEESNTVIHWYKENCMDHPDKAASPKKMYSDYKQDSELNGFKPTNSIDFGRRIAKLIPNYKDRIKIIKVDGKSERVIEGMTWRSATYGQR